MRTPFWNPRRRTLALLAWLAAIPTIAASSAFEFGYDVPPDFNGPAVVIPPGATRIDARQIEQERPKAGKVSDDVTFRPTVIVRRGHSQGSGTLIASEPEDTWVLTAWHVINTDGQALIELHRYNVGGEKNLAKTNWPRKYAATVVASDPNADLALLRVRIKGLPRLPFLARVAPAEQEPTPKTVVTSLGIDRGAKLSSWVTEVLGEARLDFNRGGGDRPFLITAHPPDHGRSGGGLFRPDGSVVGVCVGHARFNNSQPLGIFSSTRSIQALLARAPDSLAAISRSEYRSPNPRTVPATTSTSAGGSGGR